MMRYSVQFSDWICVKGYILLSFARNMAKNLGKNINKKVSSKSSWKRLDHAQQSTTFALELIQRNQLKNRTIDWWKNFIGNNEVPRNSAQIISEKVGCETEIPVQRYIFSKTRQKIIHEVVKQYTK